MKKSEIFREWMREAFEVTGAKKVDLARFLDLSAPMVSKMIGEGATRNIDADEAMRIQEFFASKGYTWGPSKHFHQMDDQTLAEYTPASSLASPKFIQDGAILLVKMGSRKTGLYLSGFSGWNPTLIDVDASLKPTDRSQEFTYRPGSEWYNGSASLGDETSICHIIGVVRALITDCSQRPNQR